MSDDLALMNNDYHDAERSASDPADTTQDTFTPSFADHGATGLYASSGTAGRGALNAGSSDPGPDPNTFGSSGAMPVRATGTDDGGLGQTRSASHDVPTTDTGAPQGHASLGERLKGNTEKIAGHLTGNPALRERGQERKTGTLGTSDNY